MSSLHALPTQKVEQPLLFKVRLFPFPPSTNPILTQAQTPINLSGL